MVIGRAERKQAELQAKLAGLDAEFTTWLASSERDMPLEKHHTQIRAVIDSLRVPVEYLHGQVEDPAGLDRWTQTERELLRVHEVWDFFRQKLALRDVPVFRPYLDLADEFTWACYEPAQRLSRGAEQPPPGSTREPPLTFLGPVAAPFAIPRGSSYAQQVGPGVMNSAQLAEAVRRLPIPLVAVPWFQLRHLPDALVLGHEVGHHVEDDFGLTLTLNGLADTALADAPGEHRRQWQGWLGEVFADTYGALCGGLAFGQALADFAMTGPEAVAGTAEYPPLRIRVLVAAEALARPGSAGWRDTLLAQWASDFPAEEPSVYDEEAAAVVQSLIDGPYPQFGGVKLTSVADASAWEETAGQTATALLKRSQLSPAIDIRVLLAAAGQAFARNPGRYQEYGATQTVLTHAHTIETKGLRASRQVIEQPGRDEAAGRALLDLITA
ncbi:MAG TPA: hypothetical protein VFQ68_22405 [Streptosporangiaceae bacterium]|nr:hypothetical protein [Streptosporangiaceae bacterium]